MRITPSLLKSFVASLLAVGTVVFTGTAAHAQILLTIDDSTPSATVITATNLPMTAASVAPYEMYFGVDLVRFFNDDTGSNTNFPTGTSTLTTVNPITSGNATVVPTLTFDQVAPDDENSNDGESDLALYNNDQSALISFTTGQAAFSGSFTVDLSSVNPNLLPLLGKTGDILAGSSVGGPLEIIGSWEIGPAISAPEPSTWLLLIGSAVVLPWLRRFRRA
jgi:hypothetical protein